MRRAARPRLRPRLARLALLAAGVYVGLWAWGGHRVGRAEEAYRQGRLDEAHAVLMDASFWRVRTGRIRDALGVVDLARGRAEEAAGHLAQARRGLFHPSAFGESRVLADFLRRGLLEPARIYAAHRAAIQERAETLFHLGVAESGLNRLEEAERHLAAAEAGAEGALKERVRARLEVVARARRDGRIDYLFDRRGEPLAAVDARSGRPVTLTAGLAPLLEGPWAARLEPGERAGRVALSLDLRLQRAAEQALGSSRGALVVVDPRDGGLLAAASRPPTVAAADGPAPLALARSYEPGSIMKLVTLAAALRNGVDVAGIFPFECPGTTTIDGKAFRDWTRHGRVASIDDAVAVSCNLAFGRLGLLVGRDALDAELRRYGLDYRSSPPAADRADFRYDVGALRAAGASRPQFALARRAEGLDSLEMTPIGAALLAAGLARGGAPIVAHLVQEKADILGETTFRRGAAGPPAERLSADAAAAIARVMRAAVASSSGTARRAALEGLDAAMKTGTSGTNPPGYDGWVIGFAPAGAPRIAWALVAEHSGKAELEAARITKEFLLRAREAI